MSLFSTQKSKQQKHNHHHHHAHAQPAMRDNREFYNTDVAVGPPLAERHWVDKDLMVCVNPRVADYTHTNFDKQIAIPMNTVFEFESNIFKGTAIVRCIDLPSTDKAYFKGRNRKLDFTFQGQFKRRLCFDRLYTGQLFERPFKNLPASYLISAAVKVIRSLAPAVIADLNSDTPHMISPLASAAQVFSVHKPGDETPLPSEAIENLELLDPKFKGMKWTARKNYFHNIKNLKEYFFEPGLVYTMSCYTHMLAPSSYLFHILGTKWGIAQYMPSAFQICSVVLPEGREAAQMNELHSVADVANDSSSSNDTNEIGDDANVEMLQSEEMACESKEDEEREEAKGKENGRPSSPRGGVRNLNGCECLVNLQVWHTKLCEELYPKKKKHRKSSGGFKSLFGK